LTELAALEQAGEVVAVGAFRSRNSLHLHYEERCVRYARAQLAWSEQPSNEELAKAEQPKREAAARESAIEARAQELLVADNAKRVEAARVKARKELEQQP
jgi:hypothetical protein